MAHAHCMLHTYGYKYTLRIMYYILLFHWNIGCINTPQCYVKGTLTVLLATRHVQMKPVRNFSRFNYRKALKTVPLSAVSVRTVSWWANAIRASTSMGFILKILRSFSLNTPQTRFIWRSPTWFSHTLKMNFKKSSRLGVKTRWYRILHLIFHLQPFKNSSLCCN
jgi:hypothetical protein